MPSQKKQAKEFFGKNYDDFTLKDVFDFSIGRLEYEEDHPEEKSKKCKGKKRNKKSAS